MKSRITALVGSLALGGSLLFVSVGTAAAVTPSAGRPATAHAQLRPPRSRQAPRSTRCAHSATARSTAGSPP